MSKIRKFVNTLWFKIALIFLLIMFSAMALMGAFFVRTYEDRVLTDFTDSTKLAAVTQRQLLKDLQHDQTSTVNRAVHDTMLSVDLDNASMILVDNNGIVRGSSDIDKQQLVGHYVGEDKHAKNILAALKTKKKYHATQERVIDGKRSLVRVTPLMTEQGKRSTTIAAFVSVTNMEPVYKNISNIRAVYFGTLLIVIALSAVVMWIIAQYFYRPIEKIQDQAKRLAVGEYSARNDLTEDDEMGDLAITLNQVAARVERDSETTLFERNRLDSVLSNMTDGVVAVNRLGDITMINQSAEQFLNVEPGTAIGRSAMELLQLSNRMSFREFSQLTEPIHSDVSNENEETILSIMPSSVKRASGFITGYILVLHDITQQQKSEIERERFVSDVSHELRTPLTSINSYIETLAEGAVDDPETAHHFLEVAQDESQRMIRLINDLLSLSRMDSHTVELNLEYINLPRFLNHVLDRFDVILNNKEETADQKSYVIKREYQLDEPPYVEVDIDKFMQVIDNIINNAIKYSPDGGEITVNMNQTKSRAIISIADQGLGIPKRSMSHIFDRFYRVDKARARAQGGSGLGLTISKEVVEALHGRIWVDSIEGKGTTFYISLPYTMFEEDPTLEDETVDNES